MKKTMEPETQQEYLDLLNEEVHNLINAFALEDAREKICEAMKEYPNAAQPHNLFGILMEKQGNHIAAMKHFRAAWALDPAFLPARKNMENYGSFTTPGAPAYQMEDCGTDAKKERVKMEYDENGIGHIVRRSSEKTRFFQL